MQAWCDSTCSLGQHILQVKWKWISAGILFILWPLIGTHLNMLCNDINKTVNCSRGILPNSVISSWQHHCPSNSLVVSRDVGFLLWKWGIRKGYSATYYSTKSRWMVGFILWSVYPQGKNPQSPLGSSLEPSAGLNLVVKRKTAPWQEWCPGFPTCSKLKITKINLHTNILSGLSCRRKDVDDGGEVRL
jgi:hypothetical protein